MFIVKYKKKIIVFLELVLKTFVKRNSKKQTITVHVCIN